MKDSATTAVGAGRTDADGAVAVDIYADVADLPLDFTNADVKAARFMLVDYTNPDGFRSDVQPNFCSSEKTVRFRYDGPLPDQK